MSQKARIANGGSSLIPNWQRQEIGSFKLTFP